MEFGVKTLVILILILIIGLFMTLLIFNFNNQSVGLIDQFFGFFANIFPK